MTFSGSLEDRILIRERYDSYADASTRGDLDDWLACWTEDCRWTTFNGIYAGRQALRDKWPELWQSIDAMGFFCQIGSISVDGDKATGRAFIREIVRTPAQDIFKVVGRYDDRLVKRGGQWLFAERSHSSHIVEGHWASQHPDWTDAE